MDGRWPYRDLFDHKQPLLYLWYLPTGFGASLEAQRLLAAALAAASLWPMSAIARRCLGRSRRVALALAAYALFLANPYIALPTNAEAYVLLPLLAAIAAPSALMAGVLLGVAAMTKGLALIFLPVLLLRWERDGWRVMAGVAMVVAVCALALAPAWREALDANVGFNAAYGAHAGGLPSRLSIDPWVMLGVLPIWTAAAAGALVLRDRTAWALALCGLVSVKATPFGFAHYYALLAPGVAVLAAAGAAATLERSAAPTRRRLRLTAATVAAVAATPVIAIFALAMSYHFPEPYADVSAAVHDLDGELYVLGDASQIYVDAGRTPERRFFFQAPLVVREKWGERVRDELTACPPDVLVVPSDQMFDVAWAGEVEALYGERRTFSRAALYTRPQRPCGGP